MKITPDMLRDAGAGADCQQFILFATEWPDGAEVTLANCLRAAELGLSFDWAANRLFPVAFREEYDRQCTPFWEEYDRQCTQFREEYYRQCAPFREEYYRQCAPFVEEYDRQCTPFREEYYRQCTPFREEYDRQCTPVFFAIASEL